MKGGGKDIRGCSRRQPRDEEKERKQAYGGIEGGRRRRTVPATELRPARVAMNTDHDRSDGE